LAFGNIALPIAAGAVWFRHGRLDPGASFSFTSTLGLGLLLASIWGVLAQLLIVFANDYADRDADGLGPGSLVSGGSRVLVRKELPAASLRRAALGVALLLFVASWTLPFVPGSAAASWTHALAVSLAALSTGALIWTYSYPPIAASYRNGGALLQGVGVGVGLPLVGALFQGFDPISQPMTFPWPLAAAGILLATAGNWMTALPDFDADTAAEKRTRVVRKSPARVRDEAISLSLLGGLAITALSTDWASPMQLGIVVALVAGALAVAAVGRRAPASLGAVVPALAFNSGMWVLAVGLCVVG